MTLGLEPGQVAKMVTILRAWHCGNHYCDWSLVRNMAEFDQANHWLIDRGDGRPSVNLVVLSFVNPLRMLNQTDSGLNGMIPAGMTQAVLAGHAVSSIMGAGYEHLLEGKTEA